MSGKKNKKTVKAKPTKAIVGKSKSKPVVKAKAKSAKKPAAKTKSVPKAVAKKTKSVAKKPTTAKAVASKGKTVATKSQMAVPSHLQASVVTASKKSFDAWKTFKPVDSRILIYVEEVAEIRSPAGLYIPASASNNGHEHGVVKALGSGVKNKKGKIRPFDVQLGDKVVFSSYAGSEIQLQGEKYRLLREEEILGVVEK